METHVPPCPAYFLRTVVLYWCWSASVNHREPHTKLHVLWSSIIDWQSTFLYFPSLIFPLVLWTSVRTYFKKKKKKSWPLEHLCHLSHPEECLFYSCFSWCSPMIISFCSFIAKLSLLCRRVWTACMFLSYSAQLFCLFFFPEMSQILSFKCFCWFYFVFSCCTFTFWKFS